MTPCAFCGEDKERFGTTLDAALFIEDRSYTLEPSFCSWQHAAAWFNQDPPDITHWKATGKRSSVDGGPGTWLILLALVVLLLGAAIALGVTLS